MHASPRAGGSVPFVDPALTALEAPIAWRRVSAAPTIDVATRFAADPTAPHLIFGHLRVAVHLTAGPGHTHIVVLRDSRHGLILHCRGGHVMRSPVDVTLQYDGVPNPADVVQSVVIFEHLCAGRSTPSIVR